MAKKQSPKHAFVTYLTPSPGQGTKPGFPRPSPLPRSQPPSASPWVLHGARQARAVLSSGAPGPVLRLQALDAPGIRRPEAASLSRWSARLALLGSFRSAPGSQSLSVGTVFSARLKKPLFEKMLLSCFISRLPNHLPRSQELRPREIKYPIILLGTEGRGGEGGTLTKPSPRSPVLSK